MMHFLKRADFYLGCLVAPMLIAWSFSGLQRLSDSDTAGNSTRSFLLFQGSCFVMVLLFLEVSILALISALYHRAGPGTVACLIAGTTVTFISGFPL